MIWYKYGLINLTSLIYSLSELFRLFKTSGMEKHWKGVWRDKIEKIRIPKESPTGQNWKCYNTKMTCLTLILLFLSSKFLALCSSRNLAKTVVLWTLQSPQLITADKDQHWIVYWSFCRWDSLTGNISHRYMLIDNTSIHLEDCEESD
jgi:hypothetical protein